MSDTEIKYKAMYKYELARAAGVSPSTFRRWCSSEGISKSSKLLKPCEVAKLCAKFAIIL